MIIFQNNSKDLRIKLQTCFINSFNSSTDELLNCVSNLFEQYPISIDNHSNYSPNKETNDNKKDADSIDINSYFDIPKFQNAIIWKNQKYVLNNYENLKDEDFELIFNVSRVPSEFFKKMKSVKSNIKFTKSFLFFFSLISGQNSNSQTNFIDIETIKANYANQ